MEPQEISMKKIAIAQFNSILGDFKYNKNQVLKLVRQAAEDPECILVVFPEACLFGYHPVDLLERQSVVDEQLRELDHLEKKIPPRIKVLIGAITKNPSNKGKPYYNSAVLLEKDKKRKIFEKELLPTYDVFDEARHIESGQVVRNIFKLAGKTVQVTICEDIWAWPLNKEDRPKYSHNPIKEITKKIDLVVNLSASPFNENKMAQRYFVTSQTAKRLKAPLIYSNLIGAQDELIFDGASFAINPKAEVIDQAKRFCEDLIFITWDQLFPKPKTQPQLKGPLVKDKPINEKRKAIVLGVRDFVEKLGFKNVHLGLSGGIDSALVACLAVEALGPENVCCIGLPGPFSSPESLRWAKEQTQKMGALWREISILDLYNVATKEINKGYGETEFGLVHENIQARLRGMLLMAYSNKTGSLLLNTSNKSELAMGYSTLYGDLCGALSPIGDLLKTQVYEMSDYFCKEKKWIPLPVVDRPPSAELRPNQKDQDSLPPYSELDLAVKKLVESTKPIRGQLENQILQQLMKSEFKRWQAPPILRVSPHAFGRGRRLPIAHRAYF